MFRNMDWKKSKMALFVLLFVGLMSIPMVTEAGLFSRTTKYDAILDNPQIVKNVKTMEGVLTNGDPETKFVLKYLRFTLNDTPGGFYRKLASADDTDSEFLSFVKANKKFCFNAMCGSIVRVISSPGATGTENHLLLATIKVFTTKPTTDDERQEIQALKFTLNGLTTYGLAQTLFEPQGFYDGIKAEFDMYLSAINGQ